jgi:CRISPR/Cas system endoribonuclease Cas6 (RAMP superfamily)
MKLGGLVGHLRLQGDLAPFAPLLRTAELVHVGKGATFGLGKVEVKAA